MIRKHQVNIRLTPEAQEILKRLAGVFGISQGDLIELLLRQQAKQSSAAKPGVLPEDILKNAQR